MFGIVSPVGETVVETMNEDAFIIGIGLIMIALYKIAFFGFVTFLVFKVGNADQAVVEAIIAELP